MENQIPSKQLERLEKHKQKKKVLKIKKRKNQFGCLVQIFGYISAIYSLREFNYSIFQFKYFVLLTVLFGSSIFFTETKLFQKGIYNSWSMWQIWWYGSIPLSLMFLLNKYVSPRENFTETFEIVDRYYSNSAKGCSNVDIITDGVSQEILLPYAEKSEIDNSDSLQITLNKGLFGIKSILKTKLK